MANADLNSIFNRIVTAKLENEDKVLDALANEHVVDEQDRRRISAAAESLVIDIRRTAKVNALDALLGEYGLGSDEGVALLRLAEALMRIPDAATMDALIADKLVPVDWRSHRGKSNSRFVNAVTLALELTAFCLRGSQGQGIGAAARRFLKNASTPVVRIAVRRATQQLAGRFVLGSTIEQAIRKSVPAERAGFSYSYDMLGEAALTQEDADFFFDAYKTAISALKPSCTESDFRDNRGVSIKLSALHPRYEMTQRDRVLKELTERLSALAHMAKDANMGLNIDAEEADRLELSLEVIEAVLRDPGLAGWDGFGIVVQAYGKAAPHVLDWLYALAGELDRKIMIRLVKGAYWDTEIKRAQVEGLKTFPVYTRKSATDVSYLSCVQKLLGMTDRIYPQFAGHNAHTVSAILDLAGENRSFEFQRIHGMGESLHTKVLGRSGVRCRIYAPVGEHRELLPYLARRMLENGANSSFVNQIVSRGWEASDIAADPFDTLQRARERNIQPIAEPEFLFGQERRNSTGWDLHNPATLATVDAIREPYRSGQWDRTAGFADSETIHNPSDPSEVVGRAGAADTAQADAALNTAVDWSGTPPAERGLILTRASDLYESHAGEMFALLCREAGRTPKDAVAELREAVDFLRYYSSEAVKLQNRHPLGLVACISPWNFPLAIFTGQVAGALAAGNGVLAKPAAQTRLIAGLAVDLLHQAGVPKDVLHFVPGSGATVGNALVSDRRVSGVAFTGSTETAARIAARMAEGQDPDSRLVAETGGLNAMIVDSTALPEQVIRDILASSFQSAGQRCSALRMLYVQSDVSEPMLKMLYGAMDEMRLGNPWDAATDVGPLIDAKAQQEIAAYIDAARSEGRLLWQCAAPEAGCFVGPAALRVNGIEDLDDEVFGPVLHVATFEAHEIDKIVAAINASGYGLTFGLHSRVDERVRSLSRRLNTGNVYVNRNQIGAVVGSQPFGGEGLSGTGPKAGGPAYLKAFTRSAFTRRPVSSGGETDAAEVQKLLTAARRLPDAPVATEEMPGPTGEANHLSHWPRGTVLCLGPSADDAARQAEIAEQAGCSAVQVADGAAGEFAHSGFLPREALATLEHVGAVALWSADDDLRRARPRSCRPPWTDHSSDGFG